MFEKLEETFNLMPSPVVSPRTDVIEEANIVVKDDKPVVPDDDAERDKMDRAIARESMKNALATGENLLELLERVAKGSEHPQAFSVAANLIKTITDTAMKIHEVSGGVTQKEKAASSEKETAPVVSNHQHLHVGSTEDLMKLIRSSK
nr:MAG TPA: Terminase DNA packaging enzyme [Caudoviricetes sp.]